MTTSRVPPLAQDRSRRHRDRLLRTAIRRFRRQGYSRTGLNEILERIPGAENEAVPVKPVANMVTVQQKLLEMAKGKDLTIERVHGVDRFLQDLL